MNTTIYPTINVPTPHDDVYPVTLTGNVQFYIAWFEVSMLAAYLVFIVIVSLDKLLPSDGSVSSSWRKDLRATAILTAASLVLSFLGNLFIEGVTMDTLSQLFWSFAVYGAFLIVWVLMAKVAFVSEQIRWMRVIAGAFLIVLAVIVARRYLMEKLIFTGLTVSVWVTLIGVVFVTMGMVGKDEMRIKRGAGMLVPLILTVSIVTGFIS